MPHSGTGFVLSKDAVRIPCMTEDEEESLVSETKKEG